MEGAKICPGRDLVPGVSPWPFILDSKTNYFDSEHLTLIESGH